MTAQPLSRAVLVFRLRNESVLLPVEVAGRLNVTLVFTTMAVTVALYRKVPLPSVVSAIAAPPAVRATWNVLAA
ncbi:hypothetical protein UFOVP1470_8 [uncultured Caudovirales phage]|uniref:Uncharacterized protein n=1 Tax=uncultured Caudovirales phage TaxID=2100421 RepID=A0A6J5Q290_9CAUD|nr:hypothetical protein UFOVP1018_6 [uncultured Caudovirales phage]CAB4183801.1 hypothetical protein UFOVP1105_7 [uncultured Caudovirales phage]CAB4202951.1 hypothetical protein UFOVP1372_51 [uncultured Caudovirales phage]CAB4214964.1 hypothetical protein UFOVP1470_8 [uncultured Caudovirales phage]CAB5230282.1 hypothetical protein UFOVP1557_51 [uncultured Caudovirales phage]